MAKWILIRKGADFEGIGKKLGVDPMLVRIMKNRGLNTSQEMEQFLNSSISMLHSGALMKDMEKACCLLLSKIGDRKKIRIIGDYDIDGVNATYILYVGLSILGADVDAVIPERIKDGYGLNEHLIAEAKDAEVDTILTCDNGISAHKSILFAQELGMTVIVTDHHEVPYRETGGEREYDIPKAAAVVDPKQPECQYPYRNICGAVVAYKLILQLLELAGTPEKKQKETAVRLLENCALATVGDVMELRDENRIIVKEGMKLMKESNNLGIRALMEANHLSGKDLTAYHLGFVLGPCMNAGGRLDTAKRVMDLLLAETKSQAAILASELIELNESRKNMTVEATNRAVMMIESGPMIHDKVLVVYLEGCHESLAGIVAGRLREKYERPVFVVTDGEDMLKGSGRSVEAYDMYEHMTKVAGVFAKFGGHKGAAGFSLPKENLDSMRQLLNQNCDFSIEELQNKVRIDAEMPFDYVTLALVEQMNMLEPFGNGNEKPSFAHRNLIFREGRIYGKNRNMAKYRVETAEGKSYYLIHFGAEIERFLSFLQNKFCIEDLSELERMMEGPHISVLYYPSVNDYMGKREIQFIMKDFC